MYVHTVHSRKGKPPTAVYMDGMQTWTHYVGVVEIAVSGNEHTSENVYMSVAYHGHVCEFEL